MVHNLILISLVIYFIKATTWPGMIFEKPAAWIESKLGEYWSKPIIGCPVCMTPWWGTALYLIGHFAWVPGFEILSFPTIIFTVFGAAGLSTVILMLNKEYDVAKKEDKILEEELERK